MSYTVWVHLRSPLKQIKRWVTSSRVYSFLFHSEVEVRLIYLNSKRSPVDPKSAEACNIKGHILEKNDPRKVIKVGGLNYAHIDPWGPQVADKDGNSQADLLLKEDGSYAILIHQPSGEVKAS